MKPILIAVLAWPALLFAADSTPVDIDSGRVTVSGLSSGGQMAHQLHVAYSDLFSGVGIVAGGPYGCADGSVATAFARCMGSTGDGLPLATFEQDIRDAAAAGAIADPAALADDRAWLFHGARDTTVAAGVSDGLAELYAAFMPADAIRYVTDVPASHTFPADGRGTACDVSEPPFVGDCGYDAAGELLAHLYGALQAPQEGKVNVLTEAQLPGAAEAGLAETAWMYVPATCRETGAGCALHLVLHGCAQAVEQVGTAFIEQSGYLRWAEANGIVLAFPQVVSAAANPYACWDWWGYSGEDYLRRGGTQMRVLAQWVQSLAEGS